VAESDFIRISSQRRGGCVDDRVAYRGDSAGASTSLWLGLADIRSDPASEDPVEQASTRVRAIVGFEVQSTYDLIRWADDLYAEFGYTTDLLIAAAGETRLTASAWKRCSTSPHSTSRIPRAKGLSSASCVISTTGPAPARRSTLTSDRDAARLATEGVPGDLPLGPAFTDR